MDAWATAVAYHSGMREPHVSPRLAIVGDHDPGKPSHEHVDRACARLPDGVTARWVATDVAAANPEVIADFDGVWLAPGSPYRSEHGAIEAIRVARERGIPLFGT